MGNIKLGGDKISRSAPLNVYVTLSPLSSNIFLAGNRPNTNYLVPRFRSQICVFINQITIGGVTAEVSIYNGFKNVRY